MLRTILAILLIPLCGIPPLSAADVWDATTQDVQGELISLGGLWEFVPWDRLDKAPGFENAEMVQVPRTQREGAYRTRFSLTKEQTQQWASLHFDAVAFRCSVFLNGNLIGTHAGGMTPFEMDITSQCHDGSNELVVLVLGAKGRMLSEEAHNPATLGFNERAQAVVDGGDKAVMGGGTFPGDGIRQGVFVRIAPLLRIGDAKLVTSFRKKLLSAKIDIENHTDNDASILTRMDILPYDIPSKTMGEDPVWTKSENFRAKKGMSVQEITGAWTDPQLWMPGDPHLYVSRIRVFNNSGQLLNERHIRFGFREVWVDGPRIMLNGLPFRAFVHGTLDAEATADVTRALFKQVMASGINMVRPHTRPPVPEFTRIADEMGVAIIAESELCFNVNYAYEQPIFWSNFERLYQERIARDKNHPSILLWSLANEVIITSSGARIGQHFFDSFLKLRQVDPTRPFMQEGDGDLRDMLPDSKGFPIDVINLHPYDVSPRKNPLWATEFPPVAWALADVKTPADIPAANKSGSVMPDRNRPWFMGEFGLAGVAYPDFLSFWTGADAYRDLFGSASGLVRSLGELTTIQLQAFRDMNMAGMDPWDMPERPALAPFLKRGFEPVTTFTRDMYSHWSSGETANRQVVTLNDSFEKKQLALTITVRQGEKEISRRSELFILGPGERRDTKWEGKMPLVREKVPLTFTVQLSDSQGTSLSGFQQNWLVYPDISAVQEWRNGKVWLCGEATNLGAIGKWTGTRVRPVTALAQIDRMRPDLVIIDQPTSAGLDEKTRLKLDGFVQSGGVLMVSGADKLHGEHVSIESNPDSDSTRIFLLQRSPLTAGMTGQDWEFWRPNHLVSSGNYTMSFGPGFDFPLIGGGRNGLMYAPLAVCRKGRGATIVSRLQLEQAIDKEPAARIFLNNLVAHATTLSKSQPGLDPTLVIQCSPEEKDALAGCMRQARIRHRMTNDHPLPPGAEILFLTGNAAPTSNELDRMADFIRGGGTIWLHRLSPTTSYLDRLSQWLGQPVNLRSPKMWLQQLELNATSPASPLLDGLNDFITCWATFCWTNGDMSSVRTTPIVDFVLSPLEQKGGVLLKEPAWTGKWDFGPGRYILTQAILIEIGRHTPNEDPGGGLAVFPMGKGRIVIDQLRWDEVMSNASSESMEKANYFVGTLWKNLTAPNSPQ